MRALVHGQDHWPGRHIGRCMDTRHMQPTAWSPLHACRSAAYAQLTVKAQKATPCLLGGDHLISRNQVADAGPPGMMS